MMRIVRVAKKKAKAGRLPKEVLGVKLPKELRKAGDRLIEQVQGPAGRQAIAGALTAVAGVAVTAALSREAGRAAAAEGGARTDAVEAFTRAADAFVSRVLDRRG